MKEKEEEALPDRLRCSRTDGRQWRCKRRVMDDMKLCEIHYLQGRHRQCREKVPESLKLQRKSKKSSNGDSNGKNHQEFQIRAHKVGTTGKLKKRKPSVGISQALNETLKKMKMKKGDTKLELIRMVLKREVEKRRKKEMDNKVNKKNKNKKKNVKKTKRESEMEENSDKGLMRALPNGLMAISPAPSILHSDNAGSSCDFKIGVEIGSVSCRRFRSKNIEPFPIGTLQVAPYGCNAGKLRKAKRKKCHWCQRSGPWSLTKCLSCRKEFFCMDCIKQRYFDTREEVKMACPVCRGTCNCKDCSANQSKDTESKDLLEDNYEVKKILCFHYLICMLLPVLIQLNKEQTAELETEAMIKGKKPSEVHIKQAECNTQRNCCNNCKASVVDLHRSCLNCSYNLCLSCYWDLQGNKSFDNKQLAKNKRMRSSNQACCSVCLTSTSFPDERVCNGMNTVSCPSKENGDCGDSLLDLRCLLPLNWTKELELSAEEIVCSYDFPESMDTSSCCSLCLGKDHKADGIEQIQEAAVRKDSNDNYLYYPRLLDIHRENLEHFQRHWGDGHPVVVRNVLQTSDLCWNPVILFCTYLERVIARFENNKDLVESSNCLDWCEVEIGIKQYFMGSLVGRTHTNTWNDMLKLKGWLSSHLFQEQFPAHYAETLRALPLQEYMNPTSGLLNLAAKVQQGITKPELGPCVYISYSSADEHLHSDSLTRLSYDSYDAVNILAHSTDVPVSTEQLTKMIKLLQKQKTQRESSRTIPDQTMKNKVNEESSFHHGDVEEEGSKCMSREEMRLSKRFSRGPKDFDMTHNCENDSNSNPSAHLCGTNQISETNNGQKECGDRGEGSDCNGKKVSNESCSAQWDVFRRQDVPKLMEYIRKHSYEFPNTNGYQEHVVHPILDQSFFLDTFHKMRLKEEFKIEPWTFEQQVGEAVIIPAGCPYQIRNPKSCVHVVLDFVSPENVAESIRLIDEVRALPEAHNAKVEKLEVKKMAVYTISEAIKEIRDLTCLTQLSK